jgi:phenylacetate-CoA ligase
MDDYFDSLETLDPEARERALLRRLPRLLARSIAGAPGWARHLAGFDPSAVINRERLAEVPVLRKSDLERAQAGDPPFGGFAVGAPSDFRRIFMSPGPIFEPMGRGRDPWRTARALFAAGFRSGDIIHNAFTFHLTPGGFMLDAGALALGCAVVPAGTGNSLQQVEAIAHLRPVGFTGTPDYLKVLLDKADELGRDVSSITRALVSGGALFPSLRQAYAERAVRVLQCYATADVGLIAYESQALEGMIVDEGVIVEIVRPGTGVPIADGEVGEVVVTNFNPVYPMIRLATGDLSAVLSGRSPCGRTNMRIRGWMGRADQTAKVKGMFVHPSQVAEVGRRHPELGRLRLVIGRHDEQDLMTLKAECGTREPEFARAVESTLQAVCKVRGAVELVEPGSLANDGKVIADDRVVG